MTRPFLSLTSGGAMIFDGLTTQCWQIAMVNNVITPPRVKNIIPGVLYTFIFTQDAAGNSFTWPSACKNAAPISTAPNSTTIENFIGLADGTLTATIPATYY